MASPLRSPLHPSEDPIPSPPHNSAVTASPLPPVTSPPTKKPPPPNPFVAHSPLKSLLLESHSRMMSQPVTSPPDLSMVTYQSPPPKHSESDPISPIVSVVENRMAKENRKEGERRKVGKERGSSLRVEPGVERRAPVVMVVVALRGSAAVLSLVSFSVMAADKTSGWDGDSFDRYTEFRYCLSMNVIVFVYSLFQLYAQIHHKIKRKHIMSLPMTYYFDFSMDQIFAYLLMSASSAAASRNDDWVISFGSDHFTNQINGSVAMSFLAFFALALSSIISAYKLFSWNS